MVGGFALCVSCGATATACHLWGHRVKGLQMGTSSYIIFLYSDDLLKEKTTNLLVVLSGRVASATTFNCKDDGPLGVVFSKVLYGQALNIGTSMTRCW
ncbi:unnamed protein product [Arabidopsis halleri]